MAISEEEFLNPVAEKNNPDSGELVKPSEASYGNLLFCPDHDCKDPDRKLFLKRSSLGNVFFSHRPGCGHPIRPQTLLHKLAIKWFEGRTTIEIPSAVVNNKTLLRKTLKLDTGKTQLEFRQYQSVIPDVMVETAGGYRLAIEIVVTNDVSADKSILLHEFNLPTVCIDLTDFYMANRELCRTDMDFIRSNLDVLLTDITRKRWAHLPRPDNTNPELEWKEKEPAETDGCLLSFLLFFIAGIFFFLYAPDLLIMICLL